MIIRSYSINIYLPNYFLVNGLGLICDWLPAESKETVIMIIIYKIANGQNTVQCTNFTKSGCSDSTRVFTKQHKPLPLAQIMLYRLQTISKIIKHSSWSNKLRSSPLLLYYFASWIKMIFFHLHAHLLRWSFAVVYSCETPLTADNPKCISRYIFNMAAAGRFLCFRFRCLKVLWKLKLTWTILNSRNV